jgi:hypothetical protein
MSMSAFLLQNTLPARDEAIPTDLLAELLMEDTKAAPRQKRAAHSLPAKIYAVMAVTTGVTFMTLRTGYELLFSHQLFI